MPLPPPDVESDEPMERSPWERCPTTGEEWCLCSECEPVLDRDLELRAFLDEQDAKNRIALAVLDFMQPALKEAV